MEWKDSSAFPSSIKSKIDWTLILDNVMLFLSILIIKLEYIETKGIYLLEKTKNTKTLIYQNCFHALSFQSYI